MSPKRILFNVNLSYLPKSGAHNPPAQVYRIFFYWLKKIRPCFSFSLVRFLHEGGLTANLSLTGSYRLLVLKNQFLSRGFLLYILKLITQQNRGVMVTPKKCKFLQLCEHQIGVQLTLLSCIFTPKWCKYDLHTILNAFKNTFAVLQQHWPGVFFLYIGV